MDLAGELLLVKAPLLGKFGVDIAPDGRLLALPVLLEGVVPCAEFLPDFFMELVRDVEWEVERACYRGVAEVGRTGSGHCCVCSISFFSALVQFVISVLLPRPCGTVVPGAVLVFLIVEDIVVGAVVPVIVAAAGSVEEQ